MPRTSFGAPRTAGSAARDAARRRIGAAAARVPGLDRLEAAAARLSRRAREQAMAAESVGRERLEVAAARVPRRRRGLVSFAGWTAPEMIRFLNQPRRSALPLRRAGFASVRAVNELSGMLPTEALLLARAITDTAPPVGMPVSHTMRDIVEKYLAASLDAYRQTAAVGVSAAGEVLLVDQLRLLYQVALDVQRAESAHNERELRIQEAFLRDRFAQMQDNGLALDPPTPDPAPHGQVGQAVIPSVPRALSTVARARRRLRVDRDPVTVFNPELKSKGRLDVRLALPSGLPVTLGVIYENRSGDTGFAATKTRLARGSRRLAGFGTAQVDLSVRLDLTQVRRFAVYATCRRLGEPIEAVAFVTEGATNAAEIPTLLGRRQGAQTTVICSGHDTRDGLFVRNESTVFVHLRDACDGFGFTHVTWISSDTPAI